jgi:hypothetical protein
MGGDLGRMPGRAGGGPRAGRGTTRTSGRCWPGRIPAWPCGREQKGGVRQIRGARQHMRRETSEHRNPDQSLQTNDG